MSRLWLLLHESPNRWMTPSEFLSAMVVNRMLRGNAYALIERDSAGEPIALVPLSPDQMEVSVVEGGEVYVYYQDGDITALAPENVIHWKGLGNGFLGLSKLDFMRATTNEAIRAQDNANSLYGKGSKPTGVLQTDSKLSAEPGYRADDAFSDEHDFVRGRSDHRGPRAQVFPDVAFAG